MGGGVQRAPGGSHPILAAPELPWRGHAAPNAPHQAFVHLAHQAQRHGQGVQPLQSVLQGSHVVADLPQVGRASLHHRSGLGGE